MKDVLFSQALLVQMLRNHLSDLSQVTSYKLSVTLQHWRGNIHNKKTSPRDKHQSNTNETFDQLSSACASVIIPYEANLQ